VASTAAADALIAASKRRQLLAFLQALDAFHADEQRIEAGVDPATGAALPPSQVPQAISAATARLAESFHAAIDLGWQEAFTAGMQEMHGGVAPSRKAQRVLQAEAAAQKAYATRFASDVAEGVPTQPGRWSEGRRTAAYAEATGAAFQIAGALGGPPGELIWWRLGEVVNHCAECPIIAANSPYTQESIPTAPRAGATPCIFTPESEVLTRRGNVPIRDVVVGDEVWTHRSRWRRVINTFINPSAGRRGVIIGGVGFTEDHRLWTLDGWRRSADVASGRLHMIHMQYAKELREMFGDDALGSSYESLPTVRELLCLRDAEGPPGRGVPVLRHESQGQSTVVGPGHEGANPQRGHQGGAQASDDVRSADVGEFQGAAGRQGLHEVLGRGRAPVHLQVQVGLAEGQRPDPGWDGDPSHQRGPDGRPSGEPGDVDRRRSPVAPHGERPSDGDGRCARGQPEGDGRQAVRGVQDGLRGGVSTGSEFVREVLLSGVRECRVDQTTAQSVRPLRRDVPADEFEGAEILQSGVLRPRSLDDGGDELPDLWDFVRAPAAQGAPAEVLFVEVLPSHVYDLEVEEDRSFLVGGIFAENCRASCKCYLTTSPPTTPPKSTSIDQNAAAATDTQFEDRVFLPPPVPPGLRLPTADERGVLRDLEIRRNEARRRAYAAAMDGDKELASVWRRQSRDLTGEIMTYAEDRQIHHVPTFRVSDVVTGKDIGRRDIDRLTHIRGLDGVTVSRAHAQAVLDAVNAAKRNLLADLETYPDVGGFTRESWRDALKAAGAPPSAFGGDLYRLGTEATCCGEADCGRCQSRLSPVVRADESECRCAQGKHAHRHAARPPAGAILATEASTPTVQASTLPDPEDWRIVNVVSSGARATLRNHVAALETLAASKKRGGPAAYDVSVGPFAEGWSDMVASGGTWVQGPLAEVERFFADWAKRAPDPIVAATWQPM
jgi:hypothetical protein